MTKEQVIAKVEKLLALSKSNVPAEAASALAKARELMAQYNVSVVENIGEDSIKRLEFESFGTKRVSGFQWELIKAIAPHYGCHSMETIYGSGRSHITLAGYDFNTKACLEVFKFVWNAWQECFNSYAKTYQSPFAKSRSEKIKDRWSYFMGFVAGVTKELKRSEQVTALVIHEPARMKEYLEEIGCEETKSTSEHSLSNIVAGVAGYQDGSFAMRNRNQVLN